MKNSTNILDLLFNPGETFCVSHNKFAHHSITREEFNNPPITLHSAGELIKTQTINIEDISLVAINPIKGIRNDQNVTAYRTILVELDEGPLAKQYQYIQDLGMPYSVCVFSGNKSLHFGITFDEDILTEALYRRIATWILTIVKNADQQTKNPSRCIRFPGHKRKDGKQKTQRLLEINGRVAMGRFLNWLAKYPECRPIPPKIVKNFSMPVKHIPKYIYDLLQEGINTERNVTWFKVALNFANAYYSEDETINILDNFFVEEPDFKRREWITVIKSAYKHYGKKD